MSLIVWERSSQTSKLCLLCSLCSYVPAVSASKVPTSASALMFLSHADVSPWLSAAQRPYVLMFFCSSVSRVSGCQGTLRRQPLCPYVLMSPALAAAKPRYGVSPLPHYFTLRLSWLLAFSRFDLPTRLPVDFFLLPALKAKGLCEFFLRCSTIYISVLAAKIKHLFGYVESIAYFCPQ